MKIFDLFEIPAELTEAVGGKAGRLCVMRKNGMNVPEGFVLYGAETEKDFEAAADYFESSALGCVSVRSSAFGEDNDFASAAGQYETVLNVRGREAFINAVKTCIASLHSETVEAYNKSFGGGEGNYMTVLVQKMVEPYAAGVAFSKDPNGDGALVEAVEGLGEGLVSGAKSADEYRIVDGKISRNGEILKDEQIEEIYKGTLRVAELFGFAADTEWAIDKNGELFWLQARPVTTDDMPTINEFDPKWDLTGRMITTCNISEMMPGAITPLTLSTSFKGFDWGEKKLLVKAHTYPSMDSVPPHYFMFSIGGHLFVDLSSIYVISKKMVMASKPSIDMSICGVELDSEVPEVDEPNGLIKLRNFIVYISNTMSKGKACKDIEKIANKLKIELSGSSYDMWKEIDSHTDEMNDAMFCHYITSAFSGAMSSALNLNLAGYFENNDEQHAAVAGCLEGIPDIESADILRKMYALAETVKKESPRESYTAESIRPLVENGGEEVRAAYKAFMERHGHRSISECEMRNLSLCDDPDTFYAQLAIVANSKGNETEADKDAWIKNRDALLAGVKKKDRMTFKYLIQFAREGARVREYTKSRIVKVTYKFKKAYGELAQSLVKDGLLPDADCIYFLTHEEIGELARTGSKKYAKKALARRRLFPEQQKLRYPEITCGRPEPIKDDEPIDENAAVLSGTPVSRGTFEGTARIVNSVSDANKLKPGEIMVARFTDAGWTPYYSTIGALVTEVGAALSHGSVVAREYSLPLVANVRNATRLIKDGDRLKIDGAAGTVRVVSRA